MLPKLDFSKVLRFREKWPWDLTTFLYRHSGRSSKHWRQADIARGDYGKPRMTRLPLLEKIHEVLEDDLAAGGSFDTLDTRVRALLLFYAFCDAENINATLNSKALREIFVRWVSHESKVRSGSNGTTLYYASVNVAKLLAYAIGTKSRDLMVLAGMTEPPRIKPVLTPQDDERLINDTTAFTGHVIDIIENLSHEAITGPLPVVIKFRTGSHFEHYSRRWSPERLRTTEVSRQSKIDRSRQRERLHPSSKPFDRRPVINLRIEAEQLMFIAQTGINLAQAMNYEVGDFRYSSHLGGYQVRRRYKDRRMGEVEFEIFSEYRPYFDAFLRWRQMIVADADEKRLFPFLMTKGGRADHRGTFQRVRQVLRAVNAPFVGPQQLRGVRVNWLLRRSGDPSLVADMAQHGIQTLQRIYRRPNHAKAAIELTRFWRKTDPALSPPGPGRCVDEAPAPLPGSPVQTPQPDCVAAAGCLFCVHHRDIASFDYVWSLISYRFLKSLELAQQPVAPKNAAPHPAFLTVERITQKVRAMEQMGDRFKKWTDEALLRIREAHFHPDWEDLIAFAERL